MRLHRDPRSDDAKAILEEIRSRDAAIAEAHARRIAVMSNALDRADSVLQRVAVAMAKVSGEGEAAALKRDVEFVRELIMAIGTNR